MLIFFLLCSVYCAAVAGFVRTGSIAERIFNFASSVISFAMSLSSTMLLYSHYTWEAPGLWETTLMASSPPMIGVCIGYWVSKRLQKHDLKPGGIDLASSPGDEDPSEGRQ
ncbi:hypothetical protein PLA107_032530 (plasmid) [Pseudomonas amygdali pv. lachrymans str. M301315]|uniref:Uncharacterized protein n=2 Tax=Pseudomonas amygdali TaxID=47877 RepID=A0AAD0PWB6_PSEAV|nr:hypothetical protein PLA107_032530 [Pseudomonas amygdali pv. lachrymans str. M301315]